MTDVHLDLKPSHQSSVTEHFAKTSMVPTEISVKNAINYLNPFIFDDEAEKKTDELSCR
jgi:hypothetical protein